ncbi:alpha/beta hydrolase family protein [Chryseolinea lacunae]|uniref:S9 family peptidase n=1 Tax=Chryseolinea lacunae TaxID=2801331 RepID=A0ABS1KQ88_9BACT|nr:prolyl oligopeptidase family serine peptidase [Chryseolinea lacunae]MBL0741640.1 S9 family peptidase [Chryseolinea lacunae]
MKKFLALAMLAAPLSLFAQKKPVNVAPKKPLTFDAFAQWKEIPYKAINPDGTLVAFTVNPQDGDGKVIFYHLKTNAQDSIKRAAEINLTADSKFAVFKIKPQQNVVKELRRQKKKKEDLPKDTLGIYTIASRKTEKVPDVKTYKVPEKVGGWVAYQLEAKKEVKPKPEDKPKPAVADTVKKKETKPKAPRKNNDTNGYTLVLKKLTDGKQTTFGFVKDFTFAKYGQGLLFATTGNDSTLKPGVYWYDLQTEKLTALLEGKSKHKFKNLTVNEDGTQVAFVADLDTTKAPQRLPKLFYWKTGEPKASLLVDETATALPKKWIVSEHAAPLFSKDGSKLFVGVNPQPVVQDTTLLPEEIVSVEVWGARDSVLYTQQNKQLDAKRKQSYWSVVHLASKNLVMLGSKEIPAIVLGDEGNADVALANTDLPYRWSDFYDPSTNTDAYVVDVNTGARQQIFSNVKGNASLSPKARYACWFNLADTSWFSYSVATQKTTSLTRNIAVRFADEENDLPDYPDAYGALGWTADDKALLVYDRYDIWSVDPENKTAPVNITKIGREQKLVFRYIRLDPEERFIDPAKPLLLSAFNETTKQSGYYKLSLKDNSLTRLLMTDHRYAVATKAKQVDKIIFTRENFREFPDVWVSDLNFAPSSSKKLSDANPQMKQYLWGTVEIVKWMSLDNVPLQGLLYKPDNFDASKKYPMIVYYYEKNSDGIHQHVSPEPLRSSVNRAMYASNGYLIFVPDIVYRVGYPGQSAYNCVMPGVTKLLSLGFVDEKNIGLQGHSWGGYQTAYLVTRTNFFKAAEAGAVVADMVSAYGGIRWETGLSRMFQYEHQQSRLGATLWDKPLRYVENSPIFFADKIETPLLLLHNDADGHVPWYQGIEMYMALRRLNKPAWMLNYNGEPHWPVKRENRIDFQIRMSQFFDHYLKGAPMPEWMRRGIPAVEKGINKGYSTK